MVIATDGGETYVLFLYRDVQWSRVQSNVGFNAGDGTRGFNVPKPSGATTYLDIESTTNVYTPGSYYFRVDQQTIQEPEGNSNQVIVISCTIVAASAYIAINNYT